MADTIDTINLDNIELKCKINKSKKTITMSIPEFMKLYEASDIYRKSKEYKDKIKLGKLFDNDKKVYKNIKDFHVEEFSA
mgnify:FL=1